MRAADTEGLDSVRPVPAAGQVLTIRIGDLAFGGEGVGRWGEFVLFVPGVLPGERAEVQVVEVRQRFARARLVRIEEASPERVVPACPYYGACGGCQYQHMAYPAQLRLKRKQVLDLLERVGGLAGAIVEEVAPCSMPYGYRNRILVRSQWDRYRQALNLGFLRAESRLVVDVEECRIASPEVNAQLRRARAHPPPKGGLKVLLREAPEGWESPHDSFFQNNFFMLGPLVEAVRAGLRRSGARHLIDAYCGVGFFSLELAGEVDRFVGVEYDRRAVEAARRNAARRGRLNGEYREGRAEELLPSLLEGMATEQTAVLLDPPRAGCWPEMIEGLRRAGPAQVIYVSCHPATLARDLRRLVADGVYRLDRVAPIDMFPQTQHIECVADLRRGT